VELLGVLRLADNGIESWLPNGQPEKIHGVVESDIDGRKVVVAYRVTGQNVSLRPTTREKALTKNIDSWYLSNSKIWVAEFTDQKRFEDLELRNIKSGPMKKIFHMPITASQLRSNPQNNRFNNLGIRRMGPLSILGPEKFKISFALEPEAKERDILAVDQKGLLHEAVAGWSSRSGIELTFNLPPEQLAGFVQCEQDTGSVHFKNISLVPNQQSKLVINTTFTTVEKKHGLKEESPKKTDFTTTLPNGVTVQLVALCEHPSQDRQWWAPDGSSIDKPEFKANNPPFKWTEDPDKLQLQCVALLRFSNYLGKAASVPGVKFSNKSLFAGFASTIADDGSQITYIVTFPKENAAFDKTDISIAVKTEQFQIAKPAGEFKPKTHQPYVLEDRSVVIRHPLRIGQLGTPSVDLTCSKQNIEFDVKAILKNGDTEQWMGGSIGDEVKFFQSTPKKQNTKIEDIKELIIEYRPYGWVTYKNVSLRPGVKTDVQIEVERTSEESANLTDRMQSVSFKEGTSIRAALRMLAIKYKKNIIPSDKVEGQVAVTELYDVTFEEILKAILGTHKYVIDGNFIRVYTAEEFEELYPDYSSTKTRQLSGAESNELFGMFMTIGTTNEHMEKVLNGNNIDEALQLCKIIAGISPKMQAIAEGTEYEPFVIAGANQFNLLHNAVKNKNIEPAKTHVKTLRQLGNNASGMFMKLMQPEQADIE
jgi:hypothetical protein